jgi:hypothetical protein
LAHTLGSHCAWAMAANASIAPQTPIAARQLNLMTMA